ncbi:MAG: tRNA (adenosine(37)-N6)-dimethylallyltransferase MiaA [Flavobacteriaceae bacterium]|nr:tRNA (adenosine(37)-N6)-dimethylallyltransferase MiaA [Flavobacteriaceae bacterium]
MSQKKLIVIIGPTGIGKTQLAIEVAKVFDTEILSSDSRQFFKEMKIGTAVPSHEELSQIKHHFIQHISIEQEYNVGEFERDAMKFIQNFFKEKDVLIMAGGSGLYEKAVTEGLNDFPEVDKSVRNNLMNELHQFGIQKLQEELKDKDPVYAANLDLENTQRVIRALEIIRSTNRTFSSYLADSLTQRSFDVIKIGIDADRQIIYDRINHRVDTMLDAGLVEEVKALCAFRDLNALQTVGYKEIFRYLEGEISLEFAISEIKKNTRRFAKRQLTWYRKDEKVNWFDYQETQKVIDFLQKEIQSSQS